MLKAELQRIVAECKFPDYTLTAVEVGVNFHIHASYMEADTVTGIVERQHTRQWVVGRCATKDQVVATCFKCVLTSMEHKTREWFMYRGVAIYQPHQSVDELLAVAAARTPEGK